MKLAFYKFLGCVDENVEIYVFDDDLVEPICEAIKDCSDNFSTKVDIDYDYGLNLGIPRTIKVKTSFEFITNLDFWENVENELLKKDIVLKENRIFYF